MNLYVWDIGPGGVRFSVMEESESAAIQAVEAHLLLPRNQWRYKYRAWEFPKNYYDVEVYEAGQVASREIS